MAVLLVAVVPDLETEAPLDDLRVWLAANNATVMAVLLLVIGVVIFGKGLGGL